MILYIIIMYSNTSRSFASMSLRLSVCVRRFILFCFYFCHCDCSNINMLLPALLSYDMHVLSMIEKQMSNN